MTPYARAVVADWRGTTTHLIREGQDSDGAPAICGASPFPGRWTTPDPNTPYCTICTYHLRRKR